MTSAHFVLSLICLINIAQETHQSSSTSVHQKRRLISANVGDKVTLECFYEDDQSSVFYWFKQPLGQEPKIISTHHPNNRKGTLNDEIKNSHTYTLELEDKTFKLTISALKVSDAATYYCAQSSSRFTMQFSEGTTVVVKEKSSFFKALVQQSDPVTFYPGKSVTLNCTADTGSCSREPSVHWFKHSEDHHPSLIYNYNQRNNKNQCEQKPHTETHTCVYNLALNNLDQINAGTYYCALTVCGRIVFGNGTRLEFRDDSNYSILVYVLGGALLFTTIILLFLICLIYKMLKANSCHSTALPAPVIEGINQSPDNLVYADPIFTPLTRSQRQKQEECVYSSVKT